MPRHDQVGAQMLQGIFSQRVVWLVAHHLDLLRHPAKTRKRFKGTSQLTDLENLRRWDLAGRHEGVDVMAPEAAIDLVLDQFFID